MNPESLCMGCMEERGQAAACSHCGWQETTAPESPQYLPPRTVLQEQYVIGRALGHGGFAVTYLGWDLNLARKLALKEYFPNGIATRATGTSSVTPYTGQANEDFGYGLEKFLEEARVLARFQNHPGIISVLNFFRANNTAYLVMEYLEGTTLKDYLTAKGDQIPCETALKLMMPVMDALREVHKAGILHRDISPDNIYITHSGQVKVLDFGAARFALSDRSQNLSVILKTGYAPEEQYRSKGKQGPWTDVYAVGATIYRALTGKIPPPAPDRLAEDEIERPTLLRASIDERLENTLMKALAVRAAERYQSMEDFQAALSSLPLDGATAIIKESEAPRFQGSSSPPPSVAAPSSHSFRIPAKWLWAGAITAGLILALALLFKNRKPEPVETQRTSVDPVKKIDPIPAPSPNPVALPNMVGKWQSVLSDGSRNWTCVSENSSNGEYRFSASCPPPLANERGKGELDVNGTWRLRASSGRTDHGTYRVITPDQVEMSGQLGTAVWTRVQAPPPQVPQRPRVTAPKPVRDQPRASSQQDWQRQEDQRRALLEQQRRQQQDAWERQRQAQLEQQQRRQKEFQESQAQRQRDQLIQEGANIIQKFFR